MKGRKLVLRGKVCMIRRGNKWKHVEIWFSKGNVNSKFVIIKKGKINKLCESDFDDLSNFIKEPNRSLIQSYQALVFTKTYPILWFYSQEKQTIYIYIYHVTRILHNTCNYKIHILSSVQRSLFPSSAHRISINKEMNVGPNSSPKAKS